LAFSEASQGFFWPSNNQRKNQMSKLNLKGAALLIAVVKGEITAAEAQKQLPIKKKPCCVGRNGLCSTHGQLFVDCQNNSEES
jgi:hypothetical protein